jgi:hypothetical protein
MPWLDRELVMAFKGSLALRIDEEFPARERHSVSKC